MRAKEFTDKKMAQTPEEPLAFDPARNLVTLVATSFGFLNAVTAVNHSQSDDYSDFL